MEYTIDNSLMLQQLARHERFLMELRKYGSFLLYGGGRFVWESESWTAFLESRRLFHSMPFTVMPIKGETFRVDVLVQ